MLLEGKILVTVDLWSPEQLVLGDEEGWRAPQFLVIAEAVVEAVESSADVSVVELRITLPTANAEQMLLGMVDGETNIALRELSPSLEQERNEGSLSLLSDSLMAAHSERHGLSHKSMETTERQRTPPGAGGKENDREKKFSLKKVRKEKEVNMLEKKFQLTRAAAIALLVAVLAVGGALTTLVSQWIGHPVLAASSTVPIYVARPVAATSAITAAAPTSAGFASVVKPALPAVVNISSSRVVRAENSPMAPFMNDPFFRQFFGNQSRVPREQREHSLGSGVIVSPEGYILTNNHVVDGATDIKVALSDKRELKGRVVGRDPKTDLAIVKIDAKNLPTLTLGDSSKLQVGDYVLAIGDPFGVGETVTQGIVSATGRAGLNIEGYEDFIQTDAAINPGNSGGALIDTRGDLVGINTAILSSGGGNQGVGFAIPINLARNVMDQILKNGKVVRGWLGIAIQDVTPSIAKAFNVPETKSALVSDIDPKGPSADSGLKRGDVITGLNGKPITGPNELRLRVAEMAPHSVAHLQVVSDGRSHEVNVKLGELQEGRAVAEAKQGTEKGPLAGVQVESLTPDTAQQLNLPANTKGVVVDSVSADSDAAAAGLQRGDVIQEINRQPVNSVGDYEQAVKKAGDKQPVVLLADRGGTRSFIVVHPG